MRQWLDDDGQARRLREHLVRSAREWDEAGREPGELYRGQRLGAALEWASARLGELNDVERAFLDAGRKASEAELAGQRRVNVRLRGLLGAVAVLLVVALVAGTLALGQAETARGLADVARSAAEDARTVADDAEAAARVARVRELAASSRVAIQSDPSLGRLLAVAAAGLLPIDADVEARLRDAWVADAVVDRIAPAPGRPPGVYAHADADGTRVAKMWGADGEGELLEVVDLATGTTLWTHEFSDPGAAVDEAFFSVDGTRVITSQFWISDADDTPPTGELGILVFDAATGRLVNRIDMGACGTLVTGVSAAGYLALMPPDDAARCYGAENPAAAFSLVNPSTGMARLVVKRTSGDAKVSADGKVLAYSTPEGIAVAKDLRTGKRRFRVDTTQFPQNSNQFRGINADGSLALFGNIPPIVLDAKTGAMIGTPLGGQNGQNLGMSFAPTGDLAYTAGLDGVLRAWDARKALELFALPGVPGGQVMPSRGDRVSVLDQATGAITVAEPRARGEAGDVHTCRGFFPAGQLVIVGTMAYAGAMADNGCDPELYGFDVAAQKVDWIGGDFEGQHIAVSPDGRLVAHQVLSSLGVVIDDAATGELRVRLEGTCTWDLAFRGGPPRRLARVRAVPRAPVLVLRQRPPVLAGRVRPGGPGHHGVPRGVGRSDGQAAAHDRVAGVLRGRPVHARRLGAPHGHRTPRAAHLLDDDLEADAWSVARPVRGHAAPHAAPVRGRRPGAARGGRDQ